MALALPNPSVPHLFNPFIGPAPGIDLGPYPSSAVLAMGTLLPSGVLVSSTPDQLANIIAALSDSSVFSLPPGGKGPLPAVVVPVGLTGPEINSLVTLPVAEVPSIPVIAPQVGFKPPAFPLPPAFPQPQPGEFPEFPNPPFFTLLPGPQFGGGDLVPPPGKVFARQPGGGGGGGFIRQPQPGPGPGGGGFIRQPQPGGGELIIRPGGGPGSLRVTDQQQQQITGQFERQTGQQIQQIEDGRLRPRQGLEQGLEKFVRDYVDFRINDPPEPGDPYYGMTMPGLPDTYTCPHCGGDRHVSQDGPDAGSEIQSPTAGQPHFADGTPLPST